MEMNRYAITKLNPENYFVWKHRMEMLLKKDDLWGVIDEEKPENADMNWIKRDSNAMATISLLIEDKEIITIRHCTSSREMWEEIKKTYEVKSLSNKLDLLRKLYGMRFCSEKPMRDYINEVMELVAKLRCIGRIIDPTDIIAILLGNLTQEYDPLITTLSAMEEKDLTVQFVKDKLMDESRRRQINLRNEPQEEAAFTSRDVRRCYGCNRLGHIRRDCYLFNRNNTRRNSYETQNKGRMQDSVNTRGTYHERKYSNGEETRGINYEAEEDTQLPSEKGEIVFSSNETSRETNEESWTIDSGASSHMTGRKTFFCKYEDIQDESRTVEIADGRTLNIVGIGEGYIDTVGKLGENIRIRATKVLHVPGLNTNLLSVRTLCKQNLSIEFQKEKCLILKGNRICAYGSLKNGIFELDRKEYTDTARSACIHLWHRRMGHKSLISVRKSLKNTNRIQIKPCSHGDFCPTCAIGKMSQKPFPLRVKTSKNKMELLHSDICGPFHPESIGGGRYFLTITDDFTGYTHTEILKYKHQAGERIITFIKKERNKTGIYPSIFRSDGGGEFRNYQLMRYFSKVGIEQQFSIPCTPQQNGTAERKNRTLLETARCMLKDNALPRFLWAEAVVTATNIGNRIVNDELNITPQEAWTGIAPDLNKIRTFGSKAYAYVSRSQRGKLDNTAQAGIMVGYAISQKGYRIWIPDRHKIIVSRSVMFQEDSEWKTPYVKTGTNCEVIVDTTQSQTDEKETTLNLRRSKRYNIGLPPDRLDL